MGMFDCIEYECVCPVCKKKVSGFQSKDRDCILDRMKPQDVDKFYSSCDTCGCWIEYHTEGNKFRRKVFGKHREALAKYEKLINIKE